jgi:hypothetical protein
MPEIENQEKLTWLSKGTHISAGGFDVEIFQVSGSGGVFNGKGFVLVPMLNFLKLEANLENISINTDYQLISGKVKTIYNLSNSLALNPSDIFPTGGGVTEQNDFASIADIQIGAGDSITSVEISGNTVTVTTAGGEVISETVSPGKIVSVTAPSGGQYVVDGTDNTVYTQGTPSGKTPSDKSSGLAQEAGATAKYKVSFQADAQQFYGFDAPVSEALAESYKEITVRGQQTRIPWKSLESGRFDKLQAKIEGSPADSVYFSRGSASMVMVAPTINDATKQLMVTGQGHQDTDELFAWYNLQPADTGGQAQAYHAGSVSLVSYQKQDIKLVLVGINGSVVPNADYVQGYLNEIYKQAVVGWQVSALEGGISIQLPHADQKTIDNTDADSRMDYTSDMKLAIKALKENPTYDKQACYLFLADNGTDNNIKGYMPLKGQFGFIFKFSEYPDSYSRTIAHEIGHGAFRLRHTFSSKNKYTQGMGATNNLMDYAAPTATQLNKYQWDLIHDPENMLFAWLEDEEEGESSTPGIYVTNNSNFFNLKTKKLSLAYRVVRKYSKPNNETYTIRIIDYRNSKNQSVVYEKNMNCPNKKVLYGKLLWDRKQNIGENAGELITIENKLLIIEITHLDYKEELKYLYNEEEKNWEYLVPIEQQFYDIEIKDNNKGFAPGVSDLKINFKVTSHEKRDFVIQCTFTNEEQNSKTFAQSYTIIKTSKKWSYIQSEKRYVYKSTLSWDGKYKGSEKVLSQSSSPLKIYLKLYKDILKSTSYVKEVEVDIIMPEQELVDEWLKYSKTDEDGFVSMHGKVSNNFDGYVIYKEKFKDKNELFDDDNSSALGHFSQNIEQINFFGANIFVHKKFAQFFNDVETTCNCDYTVKPGGGAYYMREINGSPGMSPHSYGIAVDFYPRKNPQITKYNPIHRHIILKSTGFDIAKSKRSLGYQHVKDKHNQFLSYFGNKGITYEVLFDIYSNIDNYNKLDGFKLNSEGVKQINSLVKDINSVYSNILLDYNSTKTINSEKWNTLREKTTYLRNNIDRLYSIIDLYNQTIVYKNISLLNAYLEEIATKKNELIIIEQLLLERDAKDTQDFTAEILFPKALGLSEIIDNFETLWEEISLFYSVSTWSSKSNCFYYKKYLTLSTLIKPLEPSPKRLWGNDLFVDGFCDINIDVIKAFYKVAEKYQLTKYAQWGGVFGSKIDAMHIGFNERDYDELIELEIKDKSKNTGDE